MKRRNLLIVGLILVLITVVAVKINLNQAEVATNVNKYESQLEQANKEELPVWLLLHSTTCASCIEMEKIFKQLEPEFKGKVAFIEADVNSPEARNLNFKYSVEYIPTTVLLDSKGQVAYRNVGVIQPEEMKKLLAQLGGK